MVANFTLEDIVGVCVAFALFACLTILPGYTLGWLLDILRFRRRELAFRFLISIPLSIAIFPLAFDLLARVLSPSAIWLIFAMLSAAALALLLFARTRLHRKGPLFWIAPLWCVWALFALIDLQFGKRLYFTIISFDYAIRTSFISSIGTFGLPARNPFFFPGSPVALRYHYYWLIPSALIHHIAAPRVDARQALIAGTLWCGLGLFSIIVLYLRFFRIGISRSLIAFGLLLVTGLDIIPALSFLVLAKLHLISTLPPSLEWWNDQVDGWLYTMLWEPHYVAGLIAALFGFVVISQAGKRRLVPGLVAGASFAASVGAAIYIAFVFAIFLFCWALLTLYKRWYREFVVLLVAGITAIVWSLPFLSSLRGPGSGGSFAHFTVRSFFLIDVLSQAFHFSYWQTALANLLLLPVNYFFELGLFFAVGILEYQRLRRKARLDRNDLALTLMAVISVTVCTFLRSGVIANNDLGWRGFLIAQFVLLLRGAQLLTRKKVLVVLAALGFGGTLYDQALLRFYPILSDHDVLPKVAWLSKDGQLGLRTYANREAYEWLRTHSQPQALIQQNPKQEIQDTFYGLYANRATLAEDVECATTFGGDPKACAPLQAKLQPLFTADADESTFATACESLPALDFIIVKDADPIWGREAGSWLANHKPVFVNFFVRIFPCGR